MSEYILNSYNSFIDNLGKDRNKFALLKRFIEMYTGFENFRNLVNLGVPLENIDEIFQEEIFNQVELYEFIKFISSTTRVEQEDAINNNSLKELWFNYIKAGTNFRAEMLELGNSHGKTIEFDNWRARNIERVAFELGVQARSIIHAPIAFELSDGCSVGCWFCGISASKFKGHFIGSENGLQEWRNILQNVKSILGEGMKTGFCYWATDPLDNPDYIQLIRIYKDIVGVIPQTTTAIPLKHIDVTEELLDMWEHSKDFPIRFSILNDKILQKVFDCFTPDELIGVEMVQQNNGSLIEAKSKSGKVFYSNSSKSVNLKNNSTIACVTGFIINIVTKTIKLVSPTISSIDNPNGYIIFEEVVYKDSSDFLEKLQSLIDNNMPSKIDVNKQVKFTEQATICKENNITYLKSPNVKINFTDSEEIINEISNLESTPLEIIINLVQKNVNPIKSVFIINKLWEMGLIDKIK